MTIEELLAALQAILDEAGTEPLTDDQVERYEQLEADLAVVQRDVQIRSRQQAYQTPTRTDLHVHVGTGSTDDTLERAFDSYLRTGMANQDMTDLRAQQVGTDSEGGYLVPPGFRDKLVEVRKAFGGIAEIADGFSTSSGQVLEFPSLNDTASVGGITAEEAAFVDGTDLVFGTVAMRAHKYTSTGVGTTTPLRVSVELLQDAEFDVQGLVSRALGMRIARAQAADWAHGVGTTEPQGLLDPALTPDVTLDVEATIDADELNELEDLLDPEYEANARWVFSKNTWTAIRSLVDGNSRPVIQPEAASGIGTMPERTLLGYPITIDQGIIPRTTDGASGGFAALGDIREAYVIRRVSPLVVVVNPWTRMNNGQVEYVAWERADGVIQNRSAYKVLQNIQT
jgi:HK97 family phage major capsid protein